MTNKLTIAIDVDGVIANFNREFSIILRDLYEILDKVEGVRTVSNIDIINKYDPDAGYSNNFYYIPAATADGIIYTSADPSCFELKYPNIDIQGLAK